ncbi:hypothetical protein KR032_011994 [Drosophila birchii]|nr:hypothetical protein KR032_011994 [Drosophila birchii]
MESVCIISILLSTFLHCMGLSYCPLEANTDSFVFIIMATMFLQKLKRKSGVRSSRNMLSMLIECVILCLAMQILLTLVWFPVHQLIQILADKIFTQLSTERFKKFEVIHEYAASVGVLIIELAVILKTFSIDDVQRFYGCKEDLLSDSILSIVAQQQKTVQRRQMSKQRK